MKTFEIIIEGIIFGAVKKIAATHFSESTNMIYFYNAKENITIDNVVFAIPIAKVVCIKELK